MGEVKQDISRAVPSKGERIRQLQAQAKALSREHVQQMRQALDHLHATAKEIEEGGDAYEAGFRQVARTVREDCESRAMILDTLLHRLP